MSKRQVLINAIMSVIQIIIISCILFVLYKFLLKTIGVAQLGVWALVLATTSITQIANIGLSGSVVKFVAKYIAQGKNESVSEVIQTAVISVGVFYGFVLIITYPIIKWVLSIVISNQLLPLAFDILPYALLSLWFLIVTSIFQASFDGFQRIDIRSILLMGGALFHLLLCFMLAPTYRLIGLAYARVIQNFTILLISWILLRRHLPLLPFLPYKVNKDLFKEIMGYGINFQVITVTTMLYDPITKAFLSKFGSLSMVGYYEMASRMVQQIRALIVSANQVLVPAIASIKEIQPERIKSVYLTSYQLVFYFALFLYSLIIVCVPMISKLWVGHYESIFVTFGILLTIGWFFNTLNAPAFFANMGTGELQWNVIAHVVIALLNVGFGFMLGMLYGGIGVVISWIVSLILGSCIINISYSIKNKITLIDLMPWSNGILMLSCLVGVSLVAIIQYNYNHGNTNALNSISIFLFLFIVFVPFWMNPMRKRLIGWITDELFIKAKKV